MAMGEMTAEGTLPCAWRWLGEQALCVSTGAETLARYAWLRAQAFAEIEDIVPADDSILVVLRPRAQVSAALRAALQAPLPACKPEDGRVHEFTVRYGGAAGPDLAAVARHARCAVDDYIDAHASALYTVAFLGFQPGFPYLRGLAAALQVPRQATPRLHVAAGSVAVGGCYTGIYPASGPGGWQVIGRTDARLFDAARAAPALLQAGDRVRFIPV